MRRRKVKRVKGQRRAKSSRGSSADDNGLRARKRLPFIRRTFPTTVITTTKPTASTTTTTTTTTTSTTTTAATTGSETTSFVTSATAASTPPTTTIVVERTSRRYKILNSGKIPETHLNEVSEHVDDDQKEDTDARVLELTNNILELKAKLEQLKMELEI